MKYFSIGELCLSDTAAAQKIDNSPSAEVRARLTELIDNVLDPIRQEWGSGICVTSGYRSVALNRKVGGSPTSAHCLGYAADTAPSNNDMAGYQRTVLSWAKKNKFDQIILEYPDRHSVSRWIHIAVRNAAGLQRGQILTTSNGRAYRTVRPGSAYYKV